LAAHLQLVDEAHAGGLVGGDGAVALGHGGPDARRVRVRRGPVGRAEPREVVPHLRLAPADRVGEVCVVVLTPLHRLAADPQAKFGEGHAAARRRGGAARAVKSRSRAALALDAGGRQSRAPRGGGGVRAHARVLVRTAVELFGLDEDAVAVEEECGGERRRGAQARRGGHPQRAAEHREQQRGEEHRRHDLRSDRDSRGSGTPHSTHAWWYCIQFMWQLQCIP
jgi:hypothetical protein